MIARMRSEPMRFQRFVAGDLARKRDRARGTCLIDAGRATVRWELVFSLREFPHERC